MVASFLTPNLTVSFILGVLFNAIPVMTYYADVLVPASITARQISQWSFAAQFDDFGRGVISLSSIAFFVLIIVLGIYLSMVLIGKRHWLRHDAAPVPMGRKVQALGRPDASPSRRSIALAHCADAAWRVGRRSPCSSGIFGTAAGLGLYWAAGAMANPPHTGSMAAHFTRAHDDARRAAGLRELAAQALRPPLRPDARPGQLAVARYEAAAAAKSPTKQKRTDLRRCIYLGHLAGRICQDAV